MKIIRVDMAAATITDEDTEPAFTGMGRAQADIFFC